MNSVCVLTIASFGGAANHFRLVFDFFFVVPFQLFKSQKLLLDASCWFFTPVFKVKKKRLHAYCGERERDRDGRIEPLFHASIFWFNLNLLLHIFSMKTVQTAHKTLIISTSTTLRLVVRHPEGAFYSLPHSFFDIFFCSTTLQRFFNTQNVLLVVHLAFIRLCLLLNVIFLFFCFFMFAYFRRRKMCKLMVLRSPHHERWKKGEEREMK